MVGLLFTQQHVVVPTAEVVVRLLLKAPSGVPAALALMIDESRAKAM